MPGAHDFPPEREFAALRELYREIDALLARPPHELSRVAPSISAWSPEQHLAHLALANELIARNLASLAAGSGPLVIESGEPDPGVLAIFATGVIPRGRAQSPRMVVPPAQVERAFLVDWLAGNRRDFQALEPQCELLRAATGRVRHQTLGPLSATLWLRFAALHTLHHLAIAREIEAAVDVARALPGRG
jgi:hypothetical protein